MASSDKTVVLIVENEALIRISAVQIVEDAGFVALEAWSADGAIRILEGRSDIRAVFTGIHMSGSKDGLRLSHVVRGRWPPIHLIVTSGLPEIANAGQLPANCRYIRKPYTEQQVEAVLYELFGEQPAPGQLKLRAAQTYGKMAWR